MIATARRLALLLLVAFVIPVLAPAPADAQSTVRSVERAGVRTSDGVRIALYRYPPVGALRGGGTVLLFPDVGMSHRAFDSDGRGLARYLQRRGVEVFVAEYRGGGYSDVPFGGFDFDDLVERDGEAALAFVRGQLAARGRRQGLYVGGVGLGGTVAMVLAGRHPEQVRGVIGLQAAVTLDVPNEPMGALLAQLEMPPRWLDLAALSANPLFGRTWYELLLAGDGSISKRDGERLRTRVLTTVSGRLAAQLAAFMRQRQILVGGVDVRGTIAKFRGPSLLVFAPRDNWIHPEFATPARDLLDRSAMRVRVLSRLEAAHVDYGHLGMLHGNRAERDVFAPVLAFIEPEEVSL